MVIIGEIMHAYELYIGINDCFEFLFMNLRKMEMFFGKRNHGQYLSKEN